MPLPINVISSLASKRLYVFLYHQLKLYNTSYLLHNLQDTLRYFKYTRSKISCLPRGFRKEKKKKRIIKQNYIGSYSFDIQRRDLLAGVLALVRPFGLSNPSNEV